MTSTVDARAGNEGIPPSPTTMRNILWKVSMPFNNYFEAPADLVEARRLFAEKIKADPYAFITKLEPVEPSVKTIGDLVKRIITG